MCAQARDAEIAFERQRDRERRAAESAELEAERSYKEHVRKLEKAERCVPAPGP